MFSFLQANEALQNTVAVLLAQRVRAPLKNGYMTQASDLTSVVGGTVSELASSYVADEGMDYDPNAALAILLLFEKQLGPRNMNGQLLSSILIVLLFFSAACNVFSSRFCFQSL